MCDHDVSLHCQVVILDFELFKLVTLLFKCSLTCIALLSCLVRLGLLGVVQACSCRDVLVCVSGYAHVCTKLGYLVGFTGLYDRVVRDLSFEVLELNRCALEVSLEIFDLGRL